MNSFTSFAGSTTEPNTPSAATSSKSTPTPAQLELSSIDAEASIVTAEPTDKTPVAPMSPASETANEASAFSEYSKDELIRQLIEANKRRNELPALLEEQAKAKAAKERAKETRERFNTGNLLEYPLEDYRECSKCHQKHPPDWFFNTYESDNPKLLKTCCECRKKPKPVVNRSSSRTVLKSRKLMEDDETQAQLQQARATKKARIEGGRVRKDERVRAQGQLNELGRRQTSKE